MQFISTLTAPAVWVRPGRGYGLAAYFAAYFAYICSANANETRFRQAKEPGPIRYGHLYSEIIMIGSTVGIMSCGGFGSLIAAFLLRAVASR